MIVGKRYKTTDFRSISERYKNRYFVVTNADREYIHVTFESTGEYGVEHRTINREKWHTHVVGATDVKPWEGNIIKFNFV